MRRVVGALLILHGLAHASAGMWATDIGGRMLVTLLWEAATLGFMAAGAGLIGVALLRKGWRLSIVVGSLCSLALLLLYGHPLFLLGIAADMAAMAVAIAFPGLAEPAPDRRPLRGGVRITVIALMLYTATVIGLRPWYSSWGSTRSEAQMVMVGDPPLGESRYRIDHAVTIAAPVDSVWPWLVQMGQGRAGFYSYDWLARALGIDIRNATTLVPAWQQLEVGDSVRVVQPSYLGGVVGNRGAWRVRAIEPGRAMVLENWGAFVLEPMGPTTTRLHVRTRGLGEPTPSEILLSPALLLLFEPAHFIMERGMLLGIKQRAETTAAM